MIPASILQLTDRILNETEKMGNENYLLRGIVHCLLLRQGESQVTITASEWSKMLDMPGFQEKVKEKGEVTLWLLRKE